MKEFLSRYEATQIVGLRFLRLSEGDPPKLKLEEPFCHNMMYVAARELEAGLLDVCVKRNGRCIHISELQMSMELLSMLDTMDNSCRSYAFSTNFQRPK